MKNKFIKSLMNSLNSRERERERERERSLGCFFMKKESNGIGENKNSKKISKNNKIISSILAVIMCCQSFVGAGPPLNTDNTVDIVESSISKNENKNENGLKGSEDGNENFNVKEDGSDNNKKSKSILEKIKDNYFKLAVSGLGLVVLCAAGFALWLRKLNDKKLHSEIDLNVNPSPEVDSGEIVVSEGDTLKVVLTGDSQVGKTNFANVLCGRSFDENYILTIGVDYKLKENYRVEGKEIGLLIHDATGAEAYRSILGTYLGFAQVICVCFDLNKKDGHTDENNGNIGGYLTGWVNEARQYCPKDAKFMFIGCKSDSGQEANDDGEIENAISILGLGNRVIKDSSNNNRSFFKTSAKSGNGVDKVLEAISSNVTVV
ncbi:MAG: Rab-family small GTPase [Candidatus Improbicoccus pseudotrichonymphae]|uniref:Rab-family small GTPase n=1 Tax=Candidatus Improbicoccus pseudotrichonymphae TaxID=3033792 RepID=A0AA48I422_9FIRM|nr:MAG: Rab-family small GTPase [Candidatus Improbicoccus pseudotrichonymphae]